MESDLMESRRRLFGGRESFLYDVPVGPTQLGDEAEALEQQMALFAPAMYVEPTRALVRWI